MTSPSILFTRASDVFRDRVITIGPDQWDRSTPCSEWDVRMLVNHVAVEDMWAPSLLAGRTIAEVGDTFDGDQLGHDPAEVVIEAVEAAQTAAAEPGVETRTVHLSYGDDTAGEYLMQMFTDNLVHAWDVAAATDGDRKLPADLVAACANWSESKQAMFRSAGVLGEPVPVPADADAQSRLLAAFGRDPGFQPG